MKKHRLTSFAATLLMFAAPAIVAAQAQKTDPAARMQHIDYSSYEKWINEDVRYIATVQEKSQFRKLTTDGERDRFVEDFWRRRNPDPTSQENRFKEEHDRRIAYANEHFAAKVPGWKADRGRIYILYGPPDSMKNETAGTPDVPPAQLWHYRSIPGAGEDMNTRGEATLRFVDACRCNDYRLTIPPPNN